MELTVTKAAVEHLKQDFAFTERLVKFGLEIQPAKTRLIEFGRFAASDRRKRGEGKPAIFTFLAFTHFCGTNSTGRFVVWRHTAAKRMRPKLIAIKLQLRRMMHEPVALVGAWLKGVVEGYYRYHAVPGNLNTPGRFREPALSILAARLTPSQSPAEARLGTTSPDLRPVDSLPTYSSSLILTFVSTPAPREEPCTR